MARRAVFLDRDGVLNRGIVREGRPHPPVAVDEVEILPGVAEACRDLARAGLLLIGATNQPDVARGTQTREEVLRINERLLRSLPLLEIRTCFHDDADGCACRKPKPGLLLEAAREHDIDLRQSFMVGDRWTDVAAGRAAGCLTFLITAPYNERDHCPPDHDVADLKDAAGRIVSLVSRIREPA
jgi:D-glycero-D-manno-heptose 1,7-bisphosphate phosphatase